MVQVNVTGKEQALGDICDSELIAAHLFAVIL
jgi:hypothetical protein